MIDLLTLMVSLLTLVAVLRRRQQTVTDAEREAARRDVARQFLTTRPGRELLRERLRARGLEQS